jgi:hypothetical protein
MIVYVIEYRQLGLRPRTKKPYPWIMAKNFVSLGVDEAQTEAAKRQGPPDPTDTLEFRTSTRTLVKTSIRSKTPTLPRHLARRLF